MTLDTLRETLLWCAMLNYGVLLGWFCCSPSHTSGCTGGTADGSACRRSVSPSFSSIWSSLWRCGWPGDLAGAHRVMHGSAAL